MKDSLRIALAIILGCALALAMVMRRHAAPPQTVSATPAPSQTAPQDAGAAPTTPSPSMTVPSIPGVPPTSALPPSLTSAANHRNQPALPPPARQPQPKSQPAAPASTPQPAAAAGNGGLAQPLARAALSYVGADAAAEAVWMTAINDPSTPPKERQDLIEDLNEDGFPDPKNITSDDLPLIVNRMALIENLAPDAIDDVNAAAFAEAYKDLTNMLAKLTRGG
jgi:hypothetical protein